MKNINKKEINIWLFGNVRNFNQQSIMHLALCYILLIFIIGFSSCKKIIEVNPPVTSLNAANVYESDATAAAVLTGIYANMSKTQIINGGITSLSLFPALSADELTLYNYTNQINTTYASYFTNSLTSLNTVGADFWNNIYSIVFVANSAIEGLTKSTTLTPAVKQQLLGEAKLVRGFCYFYLVNLYGNVPLALTSDYEINRLLPRSPIDQVYSQIISDLKDAKLFLNDGYIKFDRINYYPTMSAERIHPNKWAAAALLSRTYLYKGDYANAEAEATAVINTSSIYDTLPLNNVFLKNNKEVIWQLQPVVISPTANTWEARLFVLPGGGPNTNGTYPVYLSMNVVNSFENGDNRKTAWVGSVLIGTTTYYYPNKYKNISTTGPATEYNTVLRLAEQYLIRSEAKTQLGNISGAQSDLNVIRKRAGIPNTTAADKPSLLAAIFRERQVELFTEWGHRWLDLKRTNNIDAIMSAITPQKANGAPWKPYQALYPIPQIDMDRNPALIQNAGY